MQFSTGLLLAQVLTALDVAQQRLGFFHGDMRIANIMEHRPDDVSEIHQFLPRGYKAEEAKGKELLSTDEFHLPGAPSGTLPRRQVAD